MNYSDLLAAAQANPVDADYHSLRMAYARSDAYMPYASDTDNLQALQAALPAQNFDAALNAIQGLLDFCYLDIEAHMAADYVYTLREETDHANYHRLWARGLIQAILATGNGRDAESAFIVLSIPEEYTLLRVLGFRPAGQRLIQHEGHWFDVLNGQHTESGEAVELYFNIDLPRQWLERNVSD